MVRSMTGYGRKDDIRGSLRLTVELRAVNHRFQEILVRLPKNWSMLEDQIRKQVAMYVRRGRVDVTISLEGSATISSNVAIDWSIAEQFLQLSREMDQRFSLETPLTAKDLLLFPGVIHTNETEEVDREEVATWLLAVVNTAAEDLLSMKMVEGEGLQADLIHRLLSVQNWLEEVRFLAPSGTQEYHNRLHQRLSEWAAQVPFELDQQRLVQEVVFFAEKSDISEEITRLTSHCNQFSQQLEKEEAVGRKLDFLLQEMNREANTIASKANHLRIQHLAVEIKTELEKMREQVQNVE
ncbi:YicC/YloC family endoribonuclease [Brevibacillus choshinensis]|uniref:YicC/YloC family endoribonuclease n=1 Tax=Brevibacillus choshinensis TaxID=54911 RepID=UPI002E24424C|nr:YicC/YloC family endoribonuclease [Brevibacillus choshinensis]MED4749865.1 YicC family protein [Brevibacillus choshinensis]